MRTILCVLAAASAVLAGEGRNIVNYRVSAKLLPGERAVRATEVLTWHNVSRDQIRELQFHLYMNAFRNEKSTFLREDDRPELRPGPGEWGSIRIDRMQLAGGPDLKSAIRFIHPDDDNVDDRTVIAVALPSPVPTGGSITLTIDFYTRLPHVVARAGYHGNFYLVGQWFPKIGVWEATGDRHSATGHWNCHQYHAWSEFYADYGRYDVELTVPDNYVIGATGVQQSRTADAHAHTATYRFVQADVHDFAWTAQPGFLRIVRRFDPNREVSPQELAGTARLLGLPESDVRLRPFEMILLVQPEHASQIERYFRALRTAIKYFGLWYGAYPYDTITVVDPPYGAHEAGGMEYPTFITAGTNWLVSSGGNDPESVTVHEYGHQYWYGMVGNNEFEESWLDEGFNTYSTDRILGRAYPLPYAPFRLLGVPLGKTLGLPVYTYPAEERFAFLIKPRADNLLRNSWQYYDEASYAINSYVRPALTLRTLEGYLGTPAMARILRTYFQRWRYRHPDSQDFQTVVNEISGRDMKWFFDEFVFGSNLIDYAVTDIDGPAVRVRRIGAAVFPVEIRARFRNGKSETQHWDGAYRWHEFKFHNASGIESVEVDPDHKIPLDVNVANNSRSNRSQPAPFLKWTENLLFWAEQALLTIGGLV